MSCAEDELTSPFVLSGFSSVVICSGLDIEGALQRSLANTGCQDVMHLDRCCMKMYFLSNCFAPPVLTASLTGFLYKRLPIPLSSGSRMLEQSVGEWLESIGLQQYESKLLLNGFDDVRFLIVT
uniref:Uncharacterized protein n=1 Tax=Sphaerodactylus townsendi TaxID=933632 RepID=A0ACB8F554_9SAUR